MDLDLLGVREVKVDEVDKVDAFSVDNAQCSPQRKDRLGVIGVLLDNQP